MKRFKLEKVLISPEAEYDLVRARESSQQDSVLQAIKNESH